LVVSAKTGLCLFHPETGERTPLGDPETHLTTNRFNDGTTDLQGRFWAGTMHDQAQPRDLQGQFYRLDTDHSINARFDKVHVANGLGFSPDGTTMYLSDSEPSVRMIWKCAYDTATGEPGPLQPFFDTRAVAGRPDGATIDADGCYWMAGVGGSQIVRLAPEGKIDRIIDMPVEKPTKPMFGGPQLDTLFVTSIGEGYEKNKEQQEAGHLFAITGLGVTGLPQTRFAG
jgi:sugar lactone lactonase YvrE